MDLPKNTLLIAIPDIMPKKIEDYLYFTNVRNINYDYARTWFRNHNIQTGRCSAFAKDNYVVRNLDWLYSDTVGFIFKTPAKQGRHSTLCTSAVMPTLTKSLVESDIWDEGYKIMPFLATDGINDKGVFCCNLVVPSDKGHTFGTLLDVPDCHMQMVVRYILDYADNVEDAIQLLSSAVNIYTDNDNEELHYLIADKERCVVLEFIDNILVVINDFPNDISAVTNFYLDGFDGDIITGFEVEGGIQPSDTTLTANASGLERYSKIIDGYSEVSLSNAMEFAQSLNFTNAYAENSDLYSEFVGNGLEIYNYKDAFQHIMLASRDYYSHRTRSIDSQYYGTWQTVHSCVYNLDNLSLTLRCQEGDTDHTFYLNN